MKKLFLSLVVFAVLFNIGCQENMLSDPFEGAQLSEVEKTAPQITKGTIKLEGILVNPTAPLNEYYSISGLIGYECEWSSTSSYVDPTATYNVVISLNIKAEISNTDVKSVHNFLVSDQTKAALPVEADSKTAYFKSAFSVQGSESRINLICMFEVNSKGMKLVSKWLEFPETTAVDPN